MSQIIDINDYRAKNKPTALSAVLMLVNEEGYAEFEDEVLASFKNLDDLRKTLSNLLNFYSEKTEGQFNYSDLNSASLIYSTGGGTSKKHTLVLNYDIMSYKITIYVRVYTYNIPEKENNEIFKYLNYLGTTREL